MESKLFAGGIVASEVRLLCKRFRSSWFLVNIVNNACLKQEQAEYSKFLFLLNFLLSKNGEPIFERAEAPSCSFRSNKTALDAFFA